jgi:D-glycero-D-manno-heptose 1,7-bisphosphate phosphatase
MRRAAFLDRDGVINRSLIDDDGRPRPPRRSAELELLAGVPEALHALKAAGFMTLVVSNQPDIARGTLRPDVLAQINEELGRRLAIDAFFVCCHDDADDCACRKPRPGLLLRAAELLAIDLSASYMIGDRWRDVDAGANAGCRTILIDYQYPEKRPLHKPDATVGSLAEAAAWILRDQSYRRAA